jgi:hypothetical protein
MKKLLAKRDDASPVDPWAIPRFTIARAWKKLNKERKD